MALKSPSKIYLSRASKKGSDTYVAKAKKILTNAPNIRRAALLVRSGGASAERGAGKGFSFPVTAHHCNVTAAERSFLRARGRYRICEQCLWATVIPVSISI